MKISVLARDDPEWPRLLSTIAHDVYHLPAYLGAEDHFRGSASQLYVIRDDHGTLLVPLSLQEIPETRSMYDASSPYGYPAPLASSAASDAWIRGAIVRLIDHLRSAGVVSLFLRFHPLAGVSPDAFAELGTVVTQGQTVAIPLQMPFDEIRAAMRKGHRYDIRKALGAGQTAELDNDWEHFGAFLEIYEQTMTRVHASPRYFFSREYFEHLRNELSEHIALWVTKINGEIAAASLITECDGIVQYHLSGTHDDFIAQFPTKVLLDRVAQWANERGNRFFHLGGGLGGDADSLYQFKAGFSKTRQPFSTARIVINPDAFRNLTSRWSAASGMAAEDLLGFFPAYRRLLEH